jgi:predicted metal-dependent HD superfamily phosphohydrolase
MLSPLLKQFVLQLFEKELPNNLVYHNIVHTLDVVDAAERYCKLEKIRPEDEVLIISAAYLHDIGFKVKYLNNEIEAIKIAQKILPKMGYSENQIRIIADCIASTALPQSATTIHQKILCDADLDYLGRDDYYEISDKLYKEWINFGLLKEDIYYWTQVQIKFLNAHQYFTDSAIKLRKNNKERRIIELSNNLKKVNSI